MHLKLFWCFLFVLRGFPLLGGCAEVLITGEVSFGSGWGGGGLRHNYRECHSLITTLIYSLLYLGKCVILFLLVKGPFSYPI